MLVHDPESRRLADAILSDRGRRELFLALSDERDRRVRDWLAARAGGIRAGLAEGWQQGYDACDDQWLGSFNDLAGYARTLSRQPGYAQLEAMRYGPPWAQLTVPAGIRDPRHRRRWLARHPAWKDTAARAEWAKHPRPWSPAIAPAITAERIDADAHERAFVARAYATPASARTHVQAATVLLYPPPDAS